MHFGITIIVRYHSVCLPIITRCTATSLCVGMALLLLTGCGFFSNRSRPDLGYYLPLTVQLRHAPTIASAQVQYQDACGQQQSMPIGIPLAATIKRKTGLVFQKVVAEGADNATVDGYQDVSLGMTKLDLVIPRKSDKSYPATLAIGLDFAYTAGDGTVLYSKKLQSIGRGEVDVKETSCEVRGLDLIVQQAIDIVTDGMAQQLGTSSKIIETAEARRAGAPRSGGAPPPSPIAAVAQAPAASAPATPFPAATAPAASTMDEPAKLLFRAIIRDENRNLLLHPGEAISIEIEIKNEGPGAALGVEVLVSGAPAIVESIPGVVSVGDVPAGDVKRVSLDGKIGAVTEAGQAELMLVLQSKSATAQLPSAKMFLVALGPATAPEAAMVPVDVDELPKGAGKLKQPKAVGIAVGIGQFRESAMTRMKFAAHDAETMAKYWSAVSGIPPERVRRLVDTRALKSDLAEAFEEWLPMQVDPATVVYVFIAGRATVEPATGAVSVIPFDGTGTSGGRVYSLRRLQEALSKLPIQRAIVMLDLSLEPAQRKESAEQVRPRWEQEGQGKEKIMWMIGSRTAQEAHTYDVGQHGLFTYQLLLGLGGAADVDKDGTILAGELCTYTRGHVAKMAREQFGNEQEPLCIPGPGQGAMVRLQPLAKLK